MNNLPDHDSIAPLVTRPRAELRPRDISELQSQLLASVAVLTEGEIYETVAGLMRRDPHTAHDLLLKMNQVGDVDFAFPKLRVQLLADAVVEMKRVEARWELTDIDAEEAGGPADQAREVAFRADPGRFLPGAVTSSVRLLKPSGFGLIEVHGEIFAWTYAAVGYGRSDVSDLRFFIEEAGQAYGGVVVGPAALWAELELPQGWQFVAVELGDDTDGRAA